MATNLEIGKFTVRRGLRGSVGWAVLLFVYFASKTVGFVKAYPTTLSRSKLAFTLGQNKGIEILVGPGRHLETVAGYVAWNCLQVMVIIGAIWALLLATKNLRGEEDSGRWELFSSSPTTAMGATSSVLGGIGLLLLIFFIVLSLPAIAIGSLHDVSITPKSILFFNFVIVLSIALFVLIGAFASQIFPTRGRAATAAAAIFGIFFVTRAVGDITTAHWLLNFTPLGWIEKTQALTGSNAFWLVPIVILSVLIFGGTLWLAARRDLQASLVSEKYNRKPRTGLLNSSFGLTLRLCRNNVVSWILALGFLSFFYSVLTKTALQLIKDTRTNSPSVTKILHESSLASAKAYLGAIFLILLLVLMAFAANLAVATRREEDQGHLDNLLVRPIRRSQWLSGRVLFGCLAVITAALVIAVGAWIAVGSQHLGLSIGSLLAAGLNIAVAGIFAFGAGIFAFGFWPRATTFVAYGVLIWSFLLNMLNSGIHISHWVLDTSLMNQLPLVPAVNPNWQVLGIMGGLGLGLALIGGIAFNQRDLVTE